MPEPSLNATTITFRVPAGLADELRRQAEAEDRSISYLCRRAVREALASSPPLRDSRIGQGDASRFEGVR